MKTGSSYLLPAYLFEAGTGAYWLGVFLSRVAERLRSSPSGEALLVEQWWDRERGEVRLLPFSEQLVLALETLREGTPLQWSRRFHDGAGRPPPDLVERWVRIGFETHVKTSAASSDSPSESLTVGVHSGEGSASRTADGAAALPSDLLPSGQPYWVGLQTHWVAGPNGQVWATTRARIGATTSDALNVLASSLEVHLRHVVAPDPAEALFLRTVRDSSRIRRAWITGARPIWRGGRPYLLRQETVGLAAPFPPGPDPHDDPRLRHAIVLGASGSGKTAALAELARTALAERRSVILFDVHGDLAPRVVAGLPSEIRDRLLAVDVVGNPPAIPGLSVFGPVPSEDREALVAHLVAAFKRLSTENGETFWGFRLERLFETFLHVVQEQGGDLVDLWSLLTDAGRREAARLTTARPETIRFLEELEGVVRRQPDFLWPAASRVAKVVGSPLLTSLLAPREHPMELGDRLGRGESVLWRLPMGELGPEGVTFAVTLLLTRVYLEQVRRLSRDGPATGLRVLFVLDEAHLFPARLLSEIVAEGRKFGLGLVLATQYPARLAPELRDALTGAAGTVYLFRVPWATAVATGEWAGLGPDSALSVLPRLPPGWAVRSTTGPAADRRLMAMPTGPPSDLAGWQELVRDTADRCGSTVPYQDGTSPRGSDHLEEDLLLGLVALTAEGETITRTRLFRWLNAGGVADPLLALPTLEALLRRGWVWTDGEGLTLSAAGADRVGLTARTGARPESVEHRALLVGALRIFARQHERLEILRQGRFDTRLPDGRVTVLPREHPRWGPPELATYLDRRRGEWLWRLFGGRDVHVEAEVSGATRRERIERDWTKARDAGAFLLCLVGNAGRARAVRRFLTRADRPRNRWMVWTLTCAQNLDGVGSAM